MAWQGCTSLAVDGWRRAGGLATLRAGYEASLFDAVEGYGDGTSGKIRCRNLPAASPRTGGPHRTAPFAWTERHHRVSRWLTGLDWRFRHDHAVGGISQAVTVGASLRSWSSRAFASLPPRALPPRPLRAYHRGVCLTLSRRRRTSAVTSTAPAVANPSGLAWRGGFGCVDPAPRIARDASVGGRCLRLNG